MSALKIKKGSTKHSAYNLRPTFSDVRESHTLAVLVENEPGVLARVIGLFSGRGYNIESLTVAEVDHTGHLSRITIVTTGTPQVIEQIKAQLGRIVPVHEVHDLTVEGPSVERELGLFKVEGRRREADRSAAPGRDLPGQCRGQHAWQFCLRDHRRAGKDRCICRPYAPDWPDRSGPHRGRRPVARRNLSPTLSVSERKRPGIAPAFFFF